MSLIRPLIIDQPGNTLPVGAKDSQHKYRLQKKLLHYMGKAIHAYQLISAGDKILVCVSGGKDSLTMLMCLRALQLRSRDKFSIFSFVLDQTQPGWHGEKLKEFFSFHNIPFEILKRNTYKVVKEKIPDGKNYCSLCSRLRRGNIYEYAKVNGFNKIALGHHRDDAIETLLMSLFFGGQIRAMPPKLLTDDKKLILIRPLIYCQESDIAKYAALMRFPIIPCNLCGSQEKMARQWVKQLITQLSKENPKIPSNLLHALQSLKPSQLMDKQWWDFIGLDKLQLPTFSDQGM